MLSDKLLDELHQLSCQEKLRVIQLLANELADEELLRLPSSKEHPIFTPFGNEAAALTLQKMLDEYDEQQKQ